MDIYYNINRIKITSMTKYELTKVQYHFSHLLLVIY
jgi:hypothetical protein